MKEYGELSWFFSYKYKNFKPYHLEDMIVDIGRGKPFAFVRICDGEVNAIIKAHEGEDWTKDFGVKFGENIDKHKYFKDMGLAIEECIYSDHNYILGVQPRGNNKKWGHLMLKLTKDYKWCYANILRDAVKEKKIHHFWNILKTRKVVIIGNKHHSKMSNYFDFELFEIPELNCWNVTDKVLNELHVKRNHTYLFACGMPAKVWMYKLWHKYGLAEHSVQFIDVGAIFDPFCGKETRAYHKGIKT